MTQLENSQTLWLSGKKAGFVLQGGTMSTQLTAQRRLSAGEGRKEQAETDSLILY